MSYLSVILSEQDVEAIGRLLDLAEQSNFSLFEAEVGGLSVRVERMPATGSATRHDIRAPAVGIYRSAKDAAPLAPGSVLPATVVVGHIETLDQRTEVIVALDGKVVELLVQDGQFVEYGQGILVIAPLAV